MSVHGMLKSVGFARRLMASCSKVASSIDTRRTVHEKGTRIVAPPSDSLSSVPYGPHAASDKFPNYFLPDYMKDARFTPEEDTIHMLLDAIGRAEESISLAIYFFTDMRLVHALVAAQDRGVDVQVIIDKLSLDKQWGGKGHCLNSKNIALFVYDAGDSTMHQKFMVIDAQELIKGTRNWTDKANRNAEDIEVVDHPGMCAMYVARFWYLKTRSLPFKEYMDKYMHAESVGASENSVPNEL